MARKILVVDDDDEIRETLAELLTDEGFEARTAPDGQAALQAMETFRPDLVLLDLMMPKMTGWQVISEMLTRPDLARVPIFVMTAARYEGTLPTGLPVFVKPLVMDHFLYAVHAVTATAAAE